jgi:hypothetical protein
MRSGRRSGGKLTVSELNHLAEVPKLRDRSIRAMTVEYSHLFAEAALHKAIVTFLFAQYLTSTGTEDQIAKEFWSVYRHVAEGRPILDFPFKLIDPVTTVSNLRRLINEVRAESHTTDKHTK